jgi:O-antigen/teichoic acid export membrane protein
MNATQRIMKNTAVLSVSQIISFIFIFFYTIYIARYLGADGFGILSFAIAISGIFSILFDLGLSTLTVREVARDKSLAQKFLGNAIIIKIILAIVSFGLIILIINLLHYPQATVTVVYFVALSTIINSFYSLFYSIFQAYEKMEFQSIGQILNSILMFSGVFLAIKIGLSVVGFSSIYFLSSLIILIYVLILYIWKFSLPVIEIDTIFWKKILKEALPFGLAGIFVTIYYWIDSVMLSIMVGNEVVGWYNAAYRFIYIFLSFHSIFIISIFPVLSSFYKTSKGSIKFAYERSFKYMLILTVPIAVFVTVLSSKIILLIYGPSYIPSVIALQILIWTIVFMFVNGLSSNFLGSHNKQPIATKITAIGAVTNIILNILLIPKFSYVGSSFATVITELIMTPILIYIVWKNQYTNLIPLIKDLPKIIFSSLIMLIYIIYFNDLNLFILILTASIIYLGLIFITRTLDEEDILILKNIMKLSKNY